MEPQEAGDVGLADQGGDGLSEDNGRREWREEWMRDEGALVEPEG